MSTAVGGSTGYGAERDEVAAKALEGHQPLSAAASKTNSHPHSKGTGKGAARAKSKGKATTKDIVLTFWQRAKN